MKTFICLWFVLSVVDLSLCGDQMNIIIAELGQNVNLTCRAAGNGKVSVVRLTRDDLDPRYVLLYRDEQIDEEQQNSQYLGRTKLQSLISTDGEINLTLDSVTEKDSGEYECRVRTEIKNNTVIHLSVAAAQSDPPPSPPGNQDGNSRSHAALFVAVFAAVSVVVSMVMIAVIRRKRTKTPSPPDDAEEPQLI